MLTRHIVGIPVSTGEQRVPEQARGVCKGSVAESDRGEEGCGCDYVL